MVVKIEVFTSPSCPYCPMAVQLVEDGLMAVPAIALNGVVRFVGAPGKEELVEAVKEAIKG